MKIQNDGVAENRAIFTTMRIALIVPLLITWLFEAAWAQSFREAQRRYPRVRAAMKEKGPILRQLFKEKGLPYPPTEIFIRVFKQERLLEAWVWQAKKKEFALLKEYPVCATSGDLGPKRQDGDGQIPEGLYVITEFNPASSFHLSLKITYPNESDGILGAKDNWGKDIFIHGDCVTIGGVPITDDGIKELYLMALEARSAGQRNIPVHIFPTRLDDRGMKQLEEDFGNEPSLLAFW